MTVADARKTMDGKRLMFGDPQDIEAVELLELAKKAQGAHDYQASCSACGGYGVCTCSICDDNGPGDCENDGICKACGGSGRVKVVITPETIEQMTIEDLREALNR